MFLIDKYIPVNPQDSIFHQDIIQKLYILSKDDSIPHLIFYGPDSSGKKTIIKLFLEMLYDKTINNTVTSIYNITSSSNTETSEKIKQSNHHIIINPKNNNFDRYLIQEVVKEYARRMPLNVFTTQKKFKTVLINNVENLPRLAQTALRRTMEKYSDTCRFILWTRSCSKVIEPLISRCMTIRIPSPTDEKILEWVNIVSKKEGITNVSMDQYVNIIKESNGNIKKSMWLLEISKYGYSYKLITDTIIDNIVHLIMTIQLELIELIRMLFYKIMVTNISHSKLFKDLFNKLLETDYIPNSCKYKIIEMGSSCEHNLMRCRREIVHLDAFVQKVIYILHKDPKYEKHKIPISVVKQSIEFIDDKDLSRIRFLLKKPNIKCMINLSK